MYLPDHALVNTTLGGCGDLPSALSSESWSLTSPSTSQLISEVEVMLLNRGTENSIIYPSRNTL
ncbi:hypothetical protein F2Q68_00037036 [Brassica cretica]|uniref:Uncharacterized protein n=1 Tax=Brassica cretica TaxID=69181 RepID=A0A8S9H6G6_BRACR|nr:hypothetical protein F2Q68_00037036 [Brassica cretica]